MFAEAICQHIFANVNEYQKDEVIYVERPRFPSNKKAILRKLGMINAKRDGRGEISKLIDAELD